MDDRELVALFRERDVAAIYETQKKYEAYCLAIAENILGNIPDAEECVNDVFLKLWNSIPPLIPGNLKAYIARTTRNAAVDKKRLLSAEKRGGGQLDAVLSELGECAGSQTTPEEEYAGIELEKLIGRFLSSLPARDRGIFMHRYFFAEDASFIAEKFGVKESNVRLILSRTRSKLKKYLKTEGYQ